MATAAHPGLQRSTPPPRRQRGRAALLIGAGLVGAAVAGIAVGILVSDNSHNGSGRGSGVPAAEVRALPAFNAIELAGTNRVTVQVGKPQHVEVRADRNLLNRVVTQVRSGVLIISDRGSFTANSPMSVLVTVPSLQSAILSGDGRCTVTDVAAKAFSAQLSGSGELTVSGTVDRVDASLTGDGSLMLASLVARDVTVALGGTGTAMVSATHFLDAVLSGTGSITYSGQPTRVTKTVTGTGSITAQ